MNLLFLWEGVLRFHQSLKGVHGSKKIKNPWSRGMAVVFSLTSELVGGGWTTARPGRLKMSGGLR
jgi:hypothetical protein